MDPTSVLWHFWNGIHSLLSLCKCEFIVPEINRKSGNDLYFQLSCWTIPVGRGWLRASFYAFDIAGWPDQLFHRAVMLLPSPLVGKESVPGQSTLWFWTFMLFVGQCTGNLVQLLCYTQLGWKAVEAVGLGLASVPLVAPYCHSLLFLHYFVFRIQDVSFYSTNPAYP